MSGIVNFCDISHILITCLQCRNICSFYANDIANVRRKFFVLDLVAEEFCCDMDVFAIRHSFTNFKPLGIPSRLFFDKIMHCKSVRISAFLTDTDNKYGPSVNFFGRLSGSGFDLFCCFENRGRFFNGLIPVNEITVFVRNGSSSSGPYKRQRELHVNLFATDNRRKRDRVFHFCHLLVFVVNVIVNRCCHF